jgi:uncharacterized coiled-coil DUF342 family protein
VTDDKARTEVAGFVDFVNQLTAERDALKTKCEALATEKGAVTSERDALKTKCEALATEKGAVTSERDALKTKCEALATEKGVATSQIEKLHTTVDELQESVSRHEADTERIAALQQDATYFENTLKKVKLERDDFEMKCRSLNDKTSGFRKSLDRCKKEYDTMQEHLELKDTDISNLRVNLARTKHELVNTRDSVVRQQKEIANLNEELEVQQRLITESSSELERLQGLETASLARLDELKASSSSEINTLKSRNADLELRYFGLERENRVTKSMMDEIESCYNDPYSISNEGTAVLLTSNKMLSLKNIARRWMEANGFDGNPTYPIECHASRTMASVIHIPAVCNFVDNIAKNTSLDTNPLFCFRYSEQPCCATSSGLPVVWKVYKPYDQLTLIAKMIFVYKSIEHSSSFQVILSQNHIVTAICSKENASITTVTISLTVMSRTGAPSTHHIEFVDPVDLDYAEATLFPASFTIVNPPPLPVVH